MAQAIQTTLRPLHDRVLVKRLEEGDDKRGSIIIPDTAKEKPQQGKVLAVGPGKRAENSGELIPLDITVGQTVLYSKYGGTEVTVGGDDLLVLNARDVLAIVEG
jgi:chaperonin GroES